MDITIAAIDKPLPLPVLFAVFSPIPPNIKPSKGIKNEQTNPAIAIPLVSSRFCVPCAQPQWGQITASSKIVLPHLIQYFIYVPPEIYLMYTVYNAGIY